MVLMVVAKIFLMVEMRTCIPPLSLYIYVYVSLSAADWCLDGREVSMIGGRRLEAGRLKRAGNLKIPGR